VAPTSFCISSSAPSTVNTQEKASVTMSRSFELSLTNRPVSMIS
jgi:hypothetical protein